MKVGSRGDYGMRALVYLASVQDLGKPVQIHAIAQRQQIPEDYLRQLLVQLRSAGLVRSVRGPHGGYLLARKSTEIAMSEVLEVLEGAPEDMHCSYARGEAEAPCGLLAGCIIRARWRSATERMLAVMAETTLDDLVQEDPVSLKAQA